MRVRKISQILLLLFCTISTSMIAQVTVGSEEAPVKGAILQFKTKSDTESAGNENSTQGVGFPRVALVKKDQLQPMYTAAEAAALTEAQKMAHKGLVVFNSQEVESEDLVVGLNVWSGEEWSAVSETQRRSEVTFDCKQVRLYGRYFRRSPLTSENYIILPVNVTKKGDYSIVASTGNGYYFEKSGTFETTGLMEIKLDPMGTPAQNGTDHVVFTNNGVVLSESCDFSITVGVATLTYRINNCDSIKVFGDYQTRQEMDPFSNYVEIPVDVLIEGTTVWETNLVNGIKFVVNQVIDAPGNTVLVAKAQGRPKQSGKFTYDIITDGAIKNRCSFEVSFFSTLGTFSDPACKCLDIYEERPDVSNGEFFLQDCITPTDGSTVKTYCDIVNGGYTLVASYSEKTAYSVYLPTGRMTMEAQMRFENDIPRNRVTTENGVLNYADYRLSRSEFQHFPNSVAKPTLKVRIAENPTDMNDAWGLNNYGVISPRSQAENPIESTLGPRRVPSVGKIWGKRWEERAVGGGAYGGWDEVSNNRLIALYSNAAYPTHWDWGLTGSATLFEVFPKQGAAGVNNQMRMNAHNNMFGWFGETQPNHHFGKCGAATGDYDYTTKTCASGTLVPHTMNGGEGRYLQWFVK